MVKEKTDSLQTEQKLSDVSSNDLFLDELTCFTLVQEFLVYKGLNKSSEQLFNECKENNLECPSSDKIETAILKEDAHAIRGAFANNKFNTFVKLWDEKVPCTAIATDPDAWRLLFLSHVKYAVENTDNGMEALKSFISRKPITANQNEMLQYYALPYITNPQQHKSFTHLYKDTFSSELESNIRTFLKRYTKPHNKPRIMQMTCGDAHKQIRKKHKQLLHDYQRLLAVTGELTSALESAVRGETLDLANTLRNCTTIYPELFPANRTSPESMLRRSLVGLRGSEFEIDLRKVKAHLASPENNKTRLLLMQAIRWRITKTSLEEREHMVSMIVRHDLLGLKGGFQLLSLLHTPEDTPHPLQQGVARLGNSLASLRTGRDYLSTQPDQVVTLVASCLTGTRLGVHIDDVTSDMLLALLQKLSLRRAQREAMIDADMVEWLIPKLEKCLDQLTAEAPTYTLEYATALLMNLCLHSRAKQRCVPLSGRALKLLSDLLGVAPPQVLPYVNGALYSLLSEPLINQQAKHMGLERLLLFYLKQSEGELSRQLEHILRLHRGDIGPEAVDTHSEDEGEADIAFNMEVLEEELDAADPVRASGFELSGEDLLREQYRQLFPAHGVVTPGPSSLQGSLISITSASRLMNRNPGNVPDIPESEYESGSLNSFKGVTAASKFLNGRNNTTKDENYDPETDSLQSDMSLAVGQNAENNIQGSKMSFGALRATSRFRINRNNSVTSSNQETQEEQQEPGSGTSFGALRAASRFIKKKSPGKNTEENAVVEDDIPDNVSETGSRISFGSLRAASRFRKNRANNSAGENNPENIEEAENEAAEASGGISFGSLRAASRFRKNRIKNSAGENNPENVEEAENEAAEASGGISFGSLRAASRFRKSRNNSANKTETPEENPEDTEESIAGSRTSFSSLRAASRFLKKKPSGSAGNNAENTEDTITEETAEDGTSISALRATVKFLKRRPKVAPKLDKNGQPVISVNDGENGEIEGDEVIEGGDDAVTEEKTMEITADVDIERVEGGHDDDGAMKENETKNTDGDGIVKGDDETTTEIATEKTDGDGIVKGDDGTTTEITTEKMENPQGSNTSLNAKDDPDSDKKSHSSDVSLFFSTPRLARTPPTPRRIVNTEQVDKIANLLFSISHIRQEDPEDS